MATGMFETSFSGMECIGPGRADDGSSVQARSLAGSLLLIGPVGLAAPVLPGAVDVGRGGGVGDLFGLALGQELHLLAHRLGLHLQLGVQLQIDRGVDRGAQIGPTTTQPWPRISAGAALAELLGEVAAHRHAFDQQVGVAELGVLVPDRHLMSDGAAHVHDWPHLPAGDAERDHAGAVVVDHRHHVRPHLIGRAVDEAFEIGPAALGVDRIALQRELHDVADLDPLRRARPRQEIALGIVGMANADVAERIARCPGSPGFGWRSPGLPASRRVSPWAVLLQDEIDVASVLSNLTFSGAADSVCTLPWRGRVGEASDAARCEPGGVIAAHETLHPTPLASARDPPPPGEGDGVRVAWYECIWLKSASGGQPRRWWQRHVCDMRQLRLLAVKPRHVPTALRHPIAQHLVAQLARDAGGVIDLAEHTGHELHARGAQIAKLLIFLERRRVIDWYGADGMTYNSGLRARPSEFCHHWCLPGEMRQERGIESICARGDPPK